VRRPRSIRDADVAGKRVLVRADLNVPLEDGQVADETRIRASLPTLELLLERGSADVNVCSHLGRPKGEDPAFSMRPVAERLQELLPDPRLRVHENTRFNPGETKNDEAFARELAHGLDLYVNDAFGSAHRKMAEELRDDNPLEFEVQLPVDVVAASEFAEDAETKVVPYDELPEGWLGLDIGAETREQFAQVLARARTIIWNGPMGVFEWAPFAAGTKAVAESVAKADAHTVVGGADSIRALTELDLVDQVDWASTGGGAALELLEGKELPGVAAIPA
jgi:3-phosphoglycerate kinase